MSYSPFLALVIACVASLAAVFAARRMAERAQLLDVPNERSSHQVPVPRVGGVGLLAAVAVTLFTMPSLMSELRWALGGTLALAAIGLFDDLRGLRASVRFLAQLLVCVAFVYLQPLPSTIQIVNLDLPLGSLSSIAYVLWLMWMLNLFNFMDGIDALAGSQIAFASVFFCLCATGAISSFSMILLGASCGFLFWNWPRAKVFMGDVGSTSIGFLLGALALQATPDVPITASVLVLLPFIFDATFTLIRRAFERRKVWQAHRSHIYQLPQAWGNTNTKVLYVELAVLTLQLALGLIYVRADSAALRWTIFLLALLGALVVALSVWRYAKKHTQNVQW